MMPLSQALLLGYLSSPHSAFQEHAAHTTRWPVVLSSKDSQGTCIPCGVATFLFAAFTAHSSMGSERTCIRSGLATFLHCAFTAHSDLVVSKYSVNPSLLSEHHGLLRSNLV